MSDIQTVKASSNEQALLAIFDDEEKAEAVVRELIENDFPMDMISLLGKAQKSGDDPLGIYHTNVRERAKGWGEMGAFWGGVWGLLTGAAGMFLVPGLGAILVAGPVVHAIAGAVVGAGVGGGVLAGAAAVSQLTVAMHRLGVPEDKLEDLHEAVKRGEYVVLLRVSLTDANRWDRTLANAGARDTMLFPYNNERVA
jgi:uncharacterized membrane protein